MSKERFEKFEKVKGYLNSFLLIVEKYLGHELNKQQKEIAKIIHDNKTGFVFINPRFPEKRLSIAISRAQNEKLEGTSPSMIVIDDLFEQDYTSSIKLGEIIPKQDLEDEFLEKEINN